MSNVTYVTEWMNKQTKPNHANSVVKGQTELTRLEILLRALQYFLSPQNAQTK